MDIATKLTQIAQKEAENIELNASLEQTLYGTDTGGKSYYDEFWDAYQSNGERRTYNYAFQALNWTDKTYNPKYPIVCINATNLFVSNPNITDTKVPIDLRNCIINNTFSYSGLKTIREIIVDEKTKQPSTPNGFSGLSKLENLKITGVWACGNLDLNWSKLLTKESIISIITALSDTTGATLTLSTTAVTNAFGSTSSQEWIDLITSKSNQYNGLWTISLV